MTPFPRLKGYKLWANPKKCDLKGGEFSLFNSSGEQRYFLCLLQFSSCSFNYYPILFISLKIYQGYHRSCENHLVIHHLSEPGCDSRRARTCNVRFITLRPLIKFHRGRSLVLTLKPFGMWCSDTAHRPRGALELIGKLFKPHTELGPDPLGGWLAFWWRGFCVVGLPCPCALTSIPNQ